MARKKEVAPPQGIPPGYEWKDGAIVPIGAAPASSGTTANASTITPPPQTPGIAPPPPNPFLPPQSQPTLPGGGYAYAGPVSAHDFEMNLYLKGSDLPVDVSQCRVKALAFVKLPQSRSPLVVQIEPAYGKQYLPLNKTNIKQISNICKQDDLRCILGRTLVLVVYPVNNPSSMQTTRGLYVGAVE